MTKYSRQMDDIRTEVTIKGIIPNDVKQPQAGETITYTGLKQIGWKYENDKRGYAILHTARPWEVKDEPRQYKVSSVEPIENHGGFYGIKITGYSLKTTIE
jgi:hypothetical protein